LSNALELCVSHSNCEAIHNCLQCNRLFNVKAGKTVRSALSFWTFASAVPSLPDCGFAAGGSLDTKKESPKTGPDDKPHAQDGIGNMKRADGNLRLKFKSNSET
jgi:hypothetical protein